MKTANQPTLIANEIGHSIHVARHCGAIGGVEPRAVLMPVFAFSAARTGGSICL